MISGEKKICAICEGEYTDWGHNPYPFSGGRACDNCNARWVIPARLLGFEKALKSVAKVFRDEEELVASRRKKTQST